MFRLLILTIVSLFCSTFSYANYAFTICFDGSIDRMCYADVEISNQGEVDIQELPNSSSSYQTTRNQIRNAIQGVQLQGESFSSSQAQLAQRIASKMGVPISSIDVRFDRNSSRNNDFIKQQLKSMQDFETQLYGDVFNPSINSEFLSSTIQFNVNDVHDNRALKAYHQATTLKFEQLDKNDKYREADYSAKMIELRQYNKSVLSEKALNNFTTLSESLLSNDADAIIAAYKFFLASADFQKGFSASIVNNLNPASFIYPISPDCDSKWCRVGEYVGDLSSILIGGYEFFKGVGLSVGGTTLAVTVTTATPVLLPVTGSAAAGATVAGIAMAGHGLTVSAQSFTRLYSKIQTDSNIFNANQSSKLLNSLGKKDVAKIKKISRNFGVELWKYDQHRETASLALLNEKVRHALGKWGTLKDGGNQLYRHTFGLKKKDPNRLSAIEVKAGLKKGELENVYSNDPQKVIRSLSKITDLAESIMKSPHALHKTKGNIKGYWVPGVINPNEGIRVLTYKGKLSTIFPVLKKNWKNWKNIK